MKRKENEREKGVTWIEMWNIHGISADIYVCETKIQGCYTCIETFKAYKDLIYSVYVLKSDSHLRIFGFCSFLLQCTQ